MATLSRWRELSPAPHSLQRLGPSSAELLKVVQAYGEVYQNVWKNPKARANKDSVSAGSSPFLFGSLIICSHSAILF